MALAMGTTNPILGVALGSVNAGDIVTMNYGSLMTNTGMRLMSTGQGATWATQGAYGRIILDEVGHYGGTIKGVNLAWLDRRIEELRVRL